MTCPQTHKRQEIDFESWLANYLIFYKEWWGEGHMVLGLWRI